jgi:galactose dehydrogenase
MSENRQAGAGGGSSGSEDSLPPEGVTDHIYPQYAELRDASVFITGGGTGLGAYFVYAFAAQGARVTFVSLTAEPAAKLCAETERRTGQRPRFIACDIRDVAALQRAVSTAADEQGPICVLINNAARDDRHALESLTADSWDESLNTNLRPHFFTIQAVAAGMKQAQSGSIINVGSNSSLLGLAGYPAYVAAKSAIVGLTRALARELGPDGIRVNALIPGWVLTARQQQLWASPAGIEECLAQQCLKRSMQGPDVAGPALFLASHSAAMISGQALVVDGGRAML